MIWFADVNLDWLGPLAVLVITALSSWLQKRSQKRQRETEEKPQMPAPSAPSRRTPSTPASAPERSKRFDWEEELRRFLGEEVLPPSPAPASPAAPPLSAPPKKAVPAPPPVFAPAPARLPMADEGPVALPLKLADAETAYAKARKLHDETSRRLQEVVEQTKRHRLARVERRTGRTPEADAAIKLLKDPRGVREALVASIVLGPPRAFEG